MLRALAWGMLALATSCGDAQPERLQHAAEAAAPEEPQESLVDDSAKSASTTRSAAAALFARDELYGCVEVSSTLVTPTTRQPLVPPLVSLDQASLALLDDAIGLARGWSAASSDVNGRTFLAHWMLGCAAGEQDVLTRWMRQGEGRDIALSMAKANKTSKKKKVEPASPADACTVLSQIVWPFVSHKETIEAGNIARVERCSFPNRTPLASCLVVADATFANVAMTNTVSQYYYRAQEVVATDKALRNCAQVGGEWRALAEGDPALRRAEQRNLMNESKRMLHRAGE